MVRRAELSGGVTNAVATGQRATLLRRAPSLSGRRFYMSPRSTVIVTAAVGAAIVVARRPDALFDPQLYAEDGRFWFQQAWNGSALGALAITHEGYLVTYARLVALAVPFLSLRWSPLLFNLVGICLQVAPAVLFVSRRGEPLVPRLSLRVLIAAIYILLPNAEINASLTNAQWHLAVLAFLVLVVRPPQSRWVQVVDVLVVALACLSGPFGLVLVPIAFTVWWRRHQSHRTLLLGAAIAATAVQVVAIILAAHTRMHPNLGASAVRFVVILMNRFALAGFLGEDWRGPLVASSPLALIWGLPLLVAAGLVLLVALLRGPLALRLFIGMGLVVMLAGVADPAANPNRPSWPLLEHSTFGGRYFFIASLGLVLASLWLVTRLRTLRLRAAGIVLVCALLGVGIGVELQYPAYPPSHRDYYAHLLETAPRGTVVTVPVWPGGPLWTMHLVARDP